MVYQWRSQDIVDVRAQHGHTTFVQTSVRSAEAFRGSGARSPRKFLEFYSLPGWFWSHIILQCTSLQTRIWWAHMRLVIWYCAVQFQDHLAPDSWSTMMLSAPIIRMYACTGGVRPLVARARAPVCPSLAMPVTGVYMILGTWLLIESIPSQLSAYLWCTKAINHTSILNLLVYFCYKILLRHAGLPFLSISSETGAVMLASRPAPDNSIPKPGFPMRSFFGIEPVIVNQKVCSNTG